MDSKLTLKLNQEVIEQSKIYASDKKTSLSKLVENFLKSLVLNSNEKSKEFEISPFVKSMQTGTKIPSDLDYKKDYSDYLTEKYK